MRLPLVSLLVSTLLAASASARFMIYADQWHPTRPTNPEDRAGIDHVILAFAMANATAAFQPTVPISVIRSEFPNAKISIAVGGWGDDIGFFEASKSDASIDQFASDVATMLTKTGADGVDIDWEYPGGNGADYKQVPNSDKVYQIDAYPKVLAALRSAIGEKILSIAVPGKKVDMIAFTPENGPKIWPSVDYINVMAYDFMNRRDNVTKHHTSVAGSEDTIRNYLAIGAPPEKINLGFAYYAKYFTTQGDCGSSPLGCPIVLAEDPVTGADLLTSGAWTFETAHMQAVDVSNLAVSWDGTCGAEKGTKCATGCCSQYGNCGTSPQYCSGACQHAFGTGCTDADVAGSWQFALQNGVTDEVAGGQYYFDAQNRLFWTWDTPALISRKFEEIVRKYKLGGVMAWSLGEDSYDWSHIRRMAAELAKGGYGTPTLSVPDVQVPQPEDTSIAPEAPAPEVLQVQSIPSDQPAPQDAIPPPPPPPDAEPPFDPAVLKSPGGPTLQEQAPQPTTVESATKLPYKVVWVDGTADGPAGDHSEEPGSPPGYSVHYKGTGSELQEENKVGVKAAEPVLTGDTIAAASNEQADEEQDTGLSCTLRRRKRVKKV